jgi:hypothetical protein
MRKSTTDEVIREITRRAWSFGVAVLVSDTETVDADGLHVGGYFDSAPSIPMLAVATGRPEADWLGVMLHEYSHLTQWAENCTEWRRDTNSMSITDWLEGKSVSNITKVIKITQDLEADCERRTVRLIKELGANIDVGEYSRRANAYLHFHNVMRKKRKWYKAPRAVFDPAILRLCNDTIDLNFDKTPKPLWDAIMEKAF